MDNERLTGLVLAHLVGALRLATGALDLIDIPRDITPQHLQALDVERQQLEASAVALAQQGGTSWEAMARQLGVTRQSLHRRLSSKGMKYLEGPVDILQLQWEWEHQIQLALNKLSALARAEPHLFSRRIASALNGEGDDVFHYRKIVGSLAYTLTPEDIIEAGMP